MLATQTDGSSCSGTIGAMVCAPLIALGQLAILMLGLPAFFYLGIFLLAFAPVMQAGVTKLGEGDQDECQTHRRTHLGGG